MLIETIDATAGLYRCKLGEFTELAKSLPPGPPPAVLGLSHWKRNDPRITRRHVDGEVLADLSHDGQVWTYKLHQAYTLDTQGAGIVQIPEPLDIAALAD